MRKFHVMVFWLAVGFVVWVILMNLYGCAGLNPSDPRNRRPTSADLYRELVREGVIKDKGE